MAVAGSDFLCICVGTPSDSDGSADFQYVLQVASNIGLHMEGGKVVANKSTVPVGTADKVKQKIEEKLTNRGMPFEFDVVSNPELLKEGSAVIDCQRPDRIVLGVESKKRKIECVIFIPHLVVIMKRLW
jgi:UDPglucose 6-dehydrogenase